MKKTWAIIGLGWLGSELAQVLAQLGEHSWGTHRADFDFERDIFPASFFDILFINTPPLINLSPENFVKKINLDQNQRIIFISSTSVYGSTESVITEETSPKPDTKNGEWLIQVEQLLRRKFKDQLTIVRPGGLIGGHRHPIFHLSGRKDVNGENMAINLIHRCDLISIILKLSKQSDILLLNATAPYHPSKKQYYDEWADKLKISRPQFINKNEPRREIQSIYISHLMIDWKCPKLDFL